MNNNLSRNIKKHREIKGYSQEYMAQELEITQPSYAKIENDSVQITVDRLFKISKILAIDVVELLGIQQQTIYHQELKDYSIGHQSIKTLHQENKETLQELLKAKDEQIALLRELLSKK